MIELEIRKSKHYGRGDFWVIDVHPYSGHDDLPFSYIRKDGTRGDYEDYPTEDDAQKARNLYWMKHPPGETSAEKSSQGTIRTFDTGATRDTAVGKLSYVKALSPIVLRRYVQYLDAHRKQPDGSMRDFDNWKKGIPEETYLDGLGRHFIAVWLLAQGFPAEDNHGPVNLESTLCAIIFGASGWLHELLEKELKEDNHLAG